MRHFREVAREASCELSLYMTSLGVVTAVMSLLIGLVSHNPAAWGDEAVTRTSQLLAKLNHANAHRECGQEYVYYKTLCPWLQIKALRILQYFPPPARAEVYARLCDTLRGLIEKALMQKNVNTNNAAHAVLFEAVNYVVHLESAGEPEVGQARVG